jgi:hypothetical protein
MKSFLLEYKNIFYIAWCIFFVIRSWINGTIYKKLEYEDMERLNSFWKSDTTASILMYFTFWWRDYKDEEDLQIRKLMKISNLLNITFVAYTILTFIIFLYLFNQHIT